jgi:hypothetical protein
MNPAMQGGLSANTGAQRMERAGAGKGVRAGYGSGQTEGTRHQPGER